jgi:hypothetical protein
MDLFESRTHSFMIKIWLEDEEQKKWRGHVTHIPDGKRRHFESMNDILTFISTYLEMPEANPEEKKTLWQWLKRRQRRKKEQQ